MTAEPKRAQRKTPRKSIRCPRTLHCPDGSSPRAFDEREEAIRIKPKRRTVFLFRSSLHIFKNFRRNRVGEV
jgi:hypothetical protein